MFKPNINNALFYHFSDNKMHVLIEITHINSFKFVAVVEEYYILMLHILRKWPILETILYYTHCKQP